MSRFLETLGRVADLTDKLKMTKIQRGAMDDLLRQLGELDRAQDDADDAARQEFQFLERALQDRNSALNDARTYLSSLEHRLYLANDASRVECIHAINVIEDSLGAL